MLQPKEITECKDTGIHTASFDFYTGIKVAKEKGLKQSSSFQGVRRGTHFIVSCGDVMMKVDETDYPTIKRRIF